MQGLYIHVPFCANICGYCDFTRVGYHQRLVSLWLDEIQLEMKTRITDQCFDTIYLGGGTPTCLSEDELETLLKMIQPYTQFIEEFSVEVNPETITLNKVILLKKYGVNRVSIGVQSTNEKLLKLMNRKHSMKMVKEVIDLFKNAGIDNISCDAMYSLPYQSMEDVKDTLDFFIAENIPHISIYSLTIEKNSAFKRQGYTSLSCDEEADMYEFIIDYLAMHHYEQYEISNFAKEKAYSKHNLHYWHYNDFVGISMGASGKEKHQRIDNTTRFDDYLKHQYVKETIELSLEDEMFEYLMMGLRLKKGIDLRDFQARFKVSFDTIYIDQKNEAINKGLLIEEANHLKCSDKGYLILNTVLQSFLN
ncbi:MAG: radical SAM family heme chaperone HemW [Erysipelotrichaceae bacterium]